MNPDSAAIKQHIYFLFEGMDEYQDGFIEISILNDSRNFSYADKDKAVKQAIEWNKEGKNVYTVGSLMSPETAPFGRNGDKDFYATNVLWCDIDDPIDPDILEEKYKDCPPSFITITGQVPYTRMHLWWKLDQAITDSQEVRAAVTAIQQNLGGDPSAKNPSRLMRIGGSISYPKKVNRVLELTEIISTSSLPIPLEKINQHYPLIQERSKSLIDSSSVKLNLTDGWSETDIINLLNYISTEDPYINWIQIGMAIKDYGLPFAIWDEWSSKGSTYKQEEMIDKWNSFKGSGTTIGTLVHKAKEGGWSPPQREYRKPDSELINQLTKAEYQIDPETGEVLSAEKSPNVYGEKGLFYIKARDIQSNIESNHFVQDLLSNSALSVVYGESNCGKTFFMSDLAFHVAMGREWRGKRVEAGGVVYAALEGAHGLKNRVAAFKEHYKTIPENFAMVPCQIDFMDKNGNIDAFIDLLNIASNDIGPIKLVVIDTLARAMSGGDENSGSDMSMLVHHADLIRLKTNAHVCFIHHSGKDKAKGARGHSSLRAAVDTEIEINRDPDAKFSSVRIVKQRDMTMIDEFYFSLQSIILGQNQYHENVTSCIVTNYDPEIAQATKPVAKMNPIQTFIYESIVSALSDYGQEVNQGHNGTHISITYEDLRQRLEERGYKDLFDPNIPDGKVKSSTQTARVGLQKMGRINFNRNYLWVLFN